MKKTYQKPLLEVVEVTPDTALAWGPPTSIRSDIELTGLEEGTGE